MLPKRFLLNSGLDTTALLLANLHNARHDIVKLLNVLVALVHVLEHGIEQGVHDVGTKTDEHVHVLRYRFEVVRVTLVEDSAGLEGSPFLANLETLLDREVAAGDEIDDF